MVLIGSGVSGSAGSGFSGGTLTVPVIGVMPTSGGLLTATLGTTEVAINTGALVNGGVILVGAADLGLGILQMTGDPGDGGDSGQSGPSAFDEAVEQAVQAEWAQRGDMTADAMTLEGISRPHQVASLDPAPGPSQVRYQARFVNEATGKVIDVSINYDPTTGLFGTIKPASGR